METQKQKRTLTDEQKALRASTLPAMSGKERRERAEAKRRKILNFLASGEVYTGLDIASVLLSSSKPVAWSSLKAMEKDGELVSTETYIKGRKVSLWGVTEHGLAVCEEVPACQSVFEVGDLNPDRVPHQLECQGMRIAAEAAGWKNFVHDRILRAAQNEKARKAKKAGGKAKEGKIPDYICIDPLGRKVALEVERTIKTKRRMQVVMLEYLMKIKEGQIQLVVYLTPDKLAERLQNALNSVEHVVLGGQRVRLDEKHRERFIVLPYSRFPGGYNNG